MEILLDGKSFEIVDDIVMERVMSPLIAQMGSGDIEDKDFSGCSRETWGDLRGGIGLKEGRASEGRLWFSEGITLQKDLLTLGGLVATFGAFGVADAIIIDFKGATYGIAHNKIAKANTSTLVWDEKNTIENCDDAWDETANPTGVTNSADVDDKKEGTASHKSVMTVDAVVGLIATEVIPSTNMTAFEKLRLWVKSSIVLAVGDFQICLDDTAACASPIKTLDIPAITVADTWTEVEIALGDASGLTAIISIGLKMVVDKGAMTIRLDHVRATFPNPTSAVVYTDDSGTYLCICNGSNVIYSADGNSWSTISPAETVSQLVVFDRCLQGINSAGTKFRNSPVGDIDGTWVGFNLYEAYSLVHKMFTGETFTTGEPILYLATPEGAWALDPWSQYACQVKVRLPITSNSGKAGISWNAGVYISTGAGIAEVRENLSNLDFGPSKDDGLPAGYLGYVADILGLSRYLIVAVDGGANNKSSILRRHCTIGGWQQVYSTSAINKLIKHLYFSPSTLYTLGRLWFSEGTDIKYIPFPDDTDNIIEVSGYLYTTPGYVEYPKFNYLPLVSKVAVAVEAMTRKCTATEKFVVWYRINDNTTWVELGSFISSPRPTPLKFASSVGLEFYAIQLKVVPSRGTTETLMPILERISLLFYIVPDVLLAWQFTVKETGEKSQGKLEDLIAIIEKKTRVEFSPIGDTRETYRVVPEDRPFDRSFARNKLEGQMTVRVKQVYND